MSIFSKIVEKISSVFQRSEKQIKEDLTPKGKPISQLIEKLQPVLDEANARWDALDQRDLRSLAISRALEESGGQRGFSFSQLTDQGDIIAEATRARVFLQDQTSTIKGAQLYTEEESARQWKGQFGNQFNNWDNKFKNFNTQVISEDMARVAFRAYRMLEETDSARIGNEGGYGSENTIIAIYDIVYQHGFTDENSDADVESVAGMARDFLDRMLGVQRKEMDMNFEEANKVANIIDIVEYDNERYF